MIRNIIFDFGDVFINLDKTATARQMQQFGFTKINPELDMLFKNYEKGQMATEDFLGVVGNHFPRATREQLVSAWNAILLDFPEERLLFLEALAQRKAYRLFLLSNTNELHIDHEKQTMGSRFTRFQNAFEGFHLSHKIHMRKPDTEVFEYVLQTHGLKPHQTLFVDDVKENTDAAAQLGIHTWHLKVGQEDITQLNQYL